MKKINLIFCKYIEAFTLHKHLKMGKPSSSPSGKKGLLKRVEKNARKAYISKLLEMLSKGQMKPENFFLEFAALNNTDKIKYFKTKVLDQNLPEALKTFVLSPSFKNFRIKYEIAKTKNGNVLMCHIIPKSDTAAIHAANITNAPRGWKIVLIESSDSIVHMPFYEKFSNTDGNDVYSSIPSGSNKAVFFEKWSGHLGMFNVISIEGEYYCIATSKNSGEDTLYVNEFKKILMEKVFSKMSTEQLHMLFKEMSETNITISGEVLTKKDVCHGTDVLEDSFIVTCIAKSYQVIAGKEILSEGSNKAGVYYYTLEELCDFADMYKLPYSDLFTVEGTNEELNEFFLSIARERDNLTYTDLRKQVHIYGTQTNLKIKVRQGSVNYIQLSGDVIEGIVVRFYNESNYLLTLKIKGGPYTFATFLVREAIDSYKKVIGGKTYKEYKMTSDDFKSSEFLKLFEEKSIYFLTKWIITKPGKNFWTMVCQRSITLLPTLVDDNSIIGIWIRLRNAIFDELNEKFGSWKNAFVPDVEIEVPIEDFKSLPDGSHRVIDSKGNIYQIELKTVVKGQTSETLYVMRGLPGSGKSSLVKGLGTRKCSADYLMDIVRIRTNGNSIPRVLIQSKYIGWAHRVCKNIAANNLSNEDIFVDNTNMNLWEIKSYLEIANSVGASLVIVQITGSYQSIHDVPAHVLENMKKTFDSYPLTKIDAKSILASQPPSFAKNDTRLTGKCLQVRLVVIPEVFHVTLNFFDVQNKKNFPQIIESWKNFEGREIHISFGTVTCYTSENECLAAVEVSMTLPEGCPLIKDNLHITLICDGLKPSQSNDLILGNVFDPNLVTKHDLTEFLKNKNLGELPSSGFIMVM